MLALDGNTLAGGSFTFLWLSARPRVSRIWLGPLPGPLWIRLAGEEGEAGGRVEAWRRPVPCCRLVRGPRSVALARGVVRGSRGVSVRA